MVRALNVCLKSTTLDVEGFRRFVNRKNGIVARLFGVRIGVAIAARRRGRRMQRTSERGIRGRRQAGPRGPFPILTPFKQISWVNW